jgi:hypothetical protein
MIPITRLRPSSIGKVYTYSLFIRQGICWYFSFLTSPNCLWFHRYNATETKVVLDRFSLGRSHASTGQTVLRCKRTMRKQLRNSTNERDDQDAPVTRHPELFRPDEGVRLALAKNWLEQACGAGAQEREQ